LTATIKVLQTTSKRARLASESWNRVSNCLSQETTMLKAKNVQCRTKQCKNNKPAKTAITNLVAH
jgi:hypothetical protein